MPNLPPNFYGYVQRIVRDSCKENPVFVFRRLQASLPYYRWHEDYGTDKLRYYVVTKRQEQVCT